MAGGPSPSSTSPTNVSTSSFLHGSYGSTKSSSPNPPFSSQSMMVNDVFAGPTGGLSHSYNLSPIGERKPVQKSASSLHPFSELEPSISNPENPPCYAILMRKLPRSTNNEALRSMLLFAKDLLDVEFIAFELPDDKDFYTAVARFKTLAGAQEARDRLHGKPNTTNDAKMIVEVLPATGTPGALGARRNTVDGSSSRQGSTSTASSAGPANRQSSRYNGTFQTLEKMSPPNGTPGLGNGDFPVSVSNKAFSGIFSPQSPIGNAFEERSRNVGKSVINDDAGDDEELLKDPVAYARSGQSSQASMPRRTTNPQIPVSRFGNLTLSTTSGTNGMTSPPMSSYASPRSVAPIQSPGSALSAISPHTMPSGMGNMGPTNHQMTTQFYQRYNYPPVNPADQHPPCNTLYVGNLPLDTSEDELKAMFSKQRGYKRLCFRTKPNGPMCFVEFEDISFATKALNELYGHPLHNSVKGGIRLSFSKNPLGVRGGQTNSGPQAPLTPQNSMPGMGAALGAPPGFSTATGPPPGLAPPGLAASVNMSGASNFGVYSNGGFGMAPNGVRDPMLRDSMRDHMRTPNLTGSLSTTVGGTSYTGMGGAYSEYMMGR